MNIFQNEKEVLTAVRQGWSFKKIYETLCHSEKFLEQITLFEEYQEIEQTFYNKNRSNKASGCSKEEPAIE